MGIASWHLASETARVPTHAVRCKKEGRKEREEMEGREIRGGLRERIWE